MTHEDACDFLDRLQGMTREEAATALRASHLAGESEATRDGYRMGYLAGSAEGARQVRASVRATMARALL